jgi:HK97 family phage major capsid protein
MSNDIREIISLVEENGQRFDAWKEKQEAKFQQLEQHIMRAQRPSLGGGISSDSWGGSATEKKTFTAAARALISGQQEKANELFLEAKAMSVGSDPDGGYVVHNTISTGMTTVMNEISPVFKLARKIPMQTGAAFEEPIDRETAEASWVAELAARPDTTTPQLGNLIIQLHEIYAMPKISQKLIDVASIDIWQWLQSKTNIAFAVKESAAFHDGDGVGKPRGILTYTTAATGDSTRTWGQIQHVPTGTSGAFNTTTKGDCLVDMVATLKPQYRNGAVWLMNRKTAAVIRKLKEATTDNYLWQAGLQLGQPDSLLGFPVELDEDMPDIGANSLSVAFGNIEKAYTIIERPGVKFLTDPYTDKPNVRLFAYRRVGADVNNTEAIKLLKFSAA